MALHSIQAWLYWIAVLVSELRKADVYFNSRLITGILAQNLLYSDLMPRYAPCSRENVYQLSRLQS
jgi:hypothetical protein